MRYLGGCLDGDLYIYRLLGFFHHRCIYICMSSNTIDTLACLLSIFSINRLDWDRSPCV